MTFLELVQRLHSESLRSTAAPTSVSGATDRNARLFNRIADAWRNLQNERRRLANKAVRSEVRTREKAAINAATEGADNAEDAARAAQKRIDQAVSKGVIHKNTAARQKSRLAKRLAKLGADAS